MIKKVVRKIYRTIFPIKEVKFTANILLDLRFHKKKLNYFGNGNTVYTFHENGIIKSILKSDTITRGTKRKSTTNTPVVNISKYIFLIFEEKHKI